ncbi:MAG: hypothetical protein K5877_05855 [Lachnospiraceae bacterium]|nr:hypothetical protein [Lachnospiraceae bacterium]
MATATVYEDTISLLKTLDSNQLNAVHSIIVQLANKNEGWSSPLDIATEKQLWDHIDHSLEQAKASKGRDADEVIDDLMREYAT